MTKNNLILIILVMILCMTGLAASEADSDGAEKVEKIFTDLTLNDPQSGTAEISISSDDFNSWLAVKARDRDYIRDISVGFRDNNEADLSMDMDISKVEDEGYYAAMLSTMFEGHQLLKAAGTIKVAEGHFSFVINSLSINEVIVTPALVAPLVSMLLPDYDLTKPLELPHGITDIRTSEGVLTIKR
ncbi:MAG: hypothetical protein ABIJ42_07475 [Acidobacteriota bacterium]